MSFFAALVLADAAYVALSLGLHWRVHLVIVELAGVMLALGVLLLVTRLSQSTSAPSPYDPPLQRGTQLRNVLVG